MTKESIIPIPEQSGFLQPVCNGRLGVFIIDNTDPDGDSVISYREESVSEVVQIDRDTTFVVEVHILPEEEKGFLDISVSLKQNLYLFGFLKRVKKLDNELSLLTMKDIEANLSVELYKAIKNAPVESILNLNQTFSVLACVYFDEVGGE